MDNQLITSREWSRLYTNALSGSTAATWQLADIISMGVDKWGKQSVLDMTSLDNSKVRWLCSISNVSHREHTLLPEHHAEVSNLSNPKSWLKKAVKQNLKPTELRSAIRKQLQQFPSNEKKIKRTELAKALLVVEAQYKRTNDEAIKNGIKDRLNKLI